MTTPAPQVAPVVVRYAPQGAARELFLRRDRELCLDGPAGTGKSYAALQKLHLAMLKYPGARAMLARKSLISLKSSTLVTYREKVLTPGDGVRFWAAKGEEPAHYLYPNGSKVVIVGLDKPGKAMSTEYDLIVVDEATDCAVNDVEMLTTRLRNGRLPYQQLILCCNPQGPSHWLNQRMLDGRTVRLRSRHEDNPAVTEAYLETLRALSGVRRARLYSGVWQASEGAVYEDYWDEARNLLDRGAVSSRPHDLRGDCGLPRDWPRYLSFDFGYTHPFVAQWWAEDGDGRLYLYRELYMTHRLVEQHARQIREVSRWGQEGGDPLPRALIADHDAEGRATLEHHLGLVVTPAKKDVLDGIQAVQSRLLPAGDGKPRLYVLRGSTVERDGALAQAVQPTGTVEEFDSYVWDLAGDRRRGEQPVKDLDHGMDCLRYMIAHKDLRRGVVGYIEKSW